ncbi:52 kDa repressor of the inhibitor of the protein kinase-like isoform X3 [Oratosquilla oratoria]|uniref:52 kDa repressor of the inhibitor of the protein kinase-like isoform X3 n=1 Tax=Oratosquilla oratoria TaxID=337810 RepID=UPI003F75AA8E
MYHRFPKEPQRCSKWIQVTGISTLRKKTPTQLNKSQKICSHHFSQRQYASSTRLCPNAYPDQNLPDPAHPDEPEITSMDADIDLHLDTASTLHHQQIEMEILSSSLDENFGTLRTSTALHFSSSAQQSVNADTSQARHVLEQVGEVLSCSGKE